MLEVSDPVCESGFVGYVQADRVEPARYGPLPGAVTRILSRDTDSARCACLLDLPAQYELAPGSVRFAQSIDLIVIDGEVVFGDATLSARDFAFVPPAAALPQIRTVRPAAVLFFLDPPAADEEFNRRTRARGPFVTRYSDAAWQPASIARAAGLDIDLAVQILKRDPYTGARTWYVKLGPGMAVPWERHSVAEEGYLIEGDYRLAERLPERTVIGDYVPGGYFRRPPGILHSGPHSRTKRGAIWLQRSPAPLDVTFERE